MHLILINDVNYATRLEWEIQYAEGATVPYDLEPLRVYIGDNNWRPETLILVSDFEAQINARFPEVVRFAIRQDQGVEHMEVYFLPKAGLTSTRRYQLLEEIYDYGKDLMFGGTELEVKEMTNRALQVELEITLRVNIYSVDDIKEKITNVVENYLDRENQPAEMTFKRATLINRLEDEVDEVGNVTVVSPISDAFVNDIEYFSLDSLNINLILKKKRVG